MGSAAGLRRFGGSAPAARVAAYSPRVLSGTQAVELFRRMDVTHVVYLPDSTLGRWDGALRGAGTPTLVPVCREGEAWAVAGGLWLGGARPLIVMQCTGLFESGDSLRNFVHEWTMPLFAIIGYRSFLNRSALPEDACLRFTEPVLSAWALETVFVERPDQVDDIVAHYQACRRADTAGAVLLAEGGP